MMMGMFGCAVAWLVRETLEGRLLTVADAAPAHLSPGWEHWLIEAGARPVPPVLSDVTACARSLSGDDVAVLHAAVVPDPVGMFVVTEQQVGTRFRYCASVKFESPMDLTAAEGVKVADGDGWLHFFVDRRRQDEEATGQLWDHIGPLRTRAQVSPAL